jgi:hypothetical protein
MAKKRPPCMREEPKRLGTHLGEGKKRGTRNVVLI